MLFVLEEPTLNDKRRVRRGIHRPVRDLIPLPIIIQDDVQGPVDAILVVYYSEHLTALVQSVVGRISGSKLRQRSRKSGTRQTLPRVQIPFRFDDDPTNFIR